MPRFLALVAGLLATTAHSAALRRAAVGNVPQGECYECEVTCFEDCLLKYDREIVQPDFDDAKKKARAKAKAARQAGSLVELGTTLANRTRDHNEFSWRTRPGPTRSEETEAAVDQFERCLKAEKCAGHRAFWRTSWNLAGARARKNPACAPPSSRLRPALLESRNSQCSKPASACSSKTCLSRAVQQPLALVQDQAFPKHPVKIMSFAHGLQTLEQCFQSCLAATCGCQDAPSFDTIDKFNAQIRANDAVGDPVEDTPPVFNYRPAFKDECAGGHAGMKVNKGLYSAFSVGWLEVCTEDYLKAMMTTDLNAATRHCESSEADSAEHGCIWNDKKGACVWGLKPVVRCSVRFAIDKK